MGIIEMRRRGAIVDNAERINTSTQHYDWDQSIKAYWLKKELTKSCSERLIIELKNTQIILYYKKCKK